eukprot:CAMPEP_0174826234 /NCGR_PEP_ID=MMETSP1107-20130205/43707_1 /TAXON_ID=36770 /ORGANISM="Paraphysomonas vestita, Strain GFlagA" /LENGTH=852 /DNA_ID=CAMNT_0016058945 /DNA_START=752 /DNA_END=3310 /DNA_ORIENTATION=-
MEILKKREEDILRAKAKRERLLKEQEELLKADIDLNPLPTSNPTQKRKTKKKKPIKEFMVKYDSKSGLFGVDIEAERQSRLENYEIQRKMRRNADKAEIQRARVRLHRHGAYDLYNQGTISLQGRDLFHEKTPRIDSDDNEDSERLTSLSERKDRQESERIETKRSSSAEHSPQRHHTRQNQSQNQNQNQHPFHKVDTQLNHVSSRPKPIPVLNEKKIKLHNQQTDSSSNQQQNLKIEQPVENKQKSNDNLKSPLFDFPDYLNDSPIEPVIKKSNSKPKQKKVKQDIQSTNDTKNEGKKKLKEKNALDIIETDKDTSNNQVNNHPTTKDNNIIKPKVKKVLIKKPSNKIEVQKSEEELEKDKLLNQREEEKNEVMKQLDINFPDYLNDTPAPKVVSTKKPRDLSRPTKASIASQVATKPKEPEKDIKKKKMSIIKTKSNISQDESQSDQISSLKPPNKNEIQQVNKEVSKELSKDINKDQKKIIETNSSLTMPKNSSTASLNENYDNDFEEDVSEPPKSITKPKESNNNLNLSSQLSIQVNSNEVVPSAPASITPQPPSTKKSNSFSRKNSSNSGSNSNGNSQVNSPVVEAPNNINFDELTITGTKIETPVSNKSLANFSPRTLKLESDVLEDLPGESNENNEGGDYDYDMSFLNEFEDEKSNDEKLNHEKSINSVKSTSLKKEKDDNNKNNDNNNNGDDIEDVNQYLWNDDDQGLSNKYNPNEQDYQENYGDDYNGENYEYIDPESGENVGVYDQNQSNLDEGYYNEYHDADDIDKAAKSTQYGYSEDFTPYESYHSNQNSTHNNQHDHNENDDYTNTDNNNNNNNNTHNDNNNVQDESQYYDDDFIAPEE